MVLSSKLIRQSLIWLVVGLALYSIVVVLEGGTEIWESVRQLGLYGWAAVIGLSSLNIGIRFGRWQYYLSRLGSRVPAGPSFTYMLCGFAFSGTPAKAGEAVRSLYLKQRGVSYTTSLAALFVERLTDLVAVLLLAMAAALVFPNLRWLVIAAAIAILLCLPLVHSKLLHNLLRLIATKWNMAFLNKAVEVLLKLLQSSSGLLRSGPLYAGMFLSQLAAFAVSFSMYVVLTGLGVEISVYLAVGIYATGILAGALSFMPGGLGSAELVMLGLLVLVGVDETTAVAAILICRIGGLWYPIAIGIFAVVGVQLAARNGGDEETGVTEGKHV